MQRILIGLVVAAVLSSWNTVATAADAIAGKASAQSKCGQCHDADDWEGEGAQSLASLIRDIVAGKVKHKTKIELAPNEIDDIAAYWGSGGKAKGR